MIVGNSCLKNNIRIKYNSCNYCDYEHGHFITDAWAHLLGFVIEGRIQDKNTIYYLGIEGGGCCQWNLKTDGNTVYVEGATQDKKLYVLKRFVDEFDEFESKFYSYVDKITGTLK